MVNRYYVYSNKLETLENNERRRVLEVHKERYHEPVFSNRLSINGVFKIFLRVTLVGVALICCIARGYALNTDTISTQQVETVRPVTYMPNNKFNSRVIDNIDRDANSLNTLKRKLELEKIKAEIVKAKTGNDKTVSVLGDTTVTAVYIDANDSVYGRYATLQFVDGTSVDVEIGANVGEYVVSEITMSGVTLKPLKCRQRKCMRIVKVARLYPKAKSDDGNRMDKDSSYIPTPIINQHPEISDATDQNLPMVPPIIMNKD